MFLRNRKSALLGFKRCLFRSIFIFVAPLLGTFFRMPKSSVIIDRIYLLLETSAGEHHAFFALSGIISLCLDHPKSKNKHTYIQNKQT